MTLSFFFTNNEIKSFCVRFCVSKLHNEKTSTIRLSDVLPSCKGVRLFSCESVQLDHTKCLCLVKI